MRFNTVLSHHLDTRRLTAHFYHGCVARVCGVHREGPPQRRSAAAENYLPGAPSQQQKPRGTKPVVPGLPQTPTSGACTCAERLAEARQATKHKHMVNKQTASWQLQELRDMSGLLVLPLQDLCTCKWGEEVQKRERASHEHKIPKVLTVVLFTVKFGPQRNPVIIAWL